MDEDTGAKQRTAAHGDHWTCGRRKKYTDGPPAVPAGTSQQQTNAQVRARESQGGETVLHVCLDLGRDR